MVGQDAPKFQQEMLENRNTNTEKETEMENNITVNVRTFASDWADKWRKDNRDWTPWNKQFCEDEWEAHGGFDLNLYVDDGVLTVTAYNILTDNEGVQTTDYSNYVVVVKMDSTTEKEPRVEDEYQELTFIQWVERFNPIRNPKEHEPDNIEFSISGDDEDFVDEHSNTFIWTRVMGDDGREYIVEGKHFVDREVYYVTNVEWNPNVEYQVSWRDEDSLWCDGCGDPIEGNGVFPWESVPADIESVCKGESAQLCVVCDSRLRSMRRQFNVAVLTGTVYEATIFAATEEEALEIARSEGHFLSPMWEECDIDRTVIINDENTYGFGIGHYRVSK